MGPDRAGLKGAVQKGLYISYPLRYRYHYYLTPTHGTTVVFQEPSLADLAHVIKAGTGIEASLQTR